MTIVAKNRLKLATRLFIALAGGALILPGCDMDPHDSITKGPANGSGSKQAGKPEGPALPTEQELGMPIYPNSTVYVDLLGKPLTPSITESLSSATLTSVDGVNKVVDFYKQAISNTDSEGHRKPATVSEKVEQGMKKFTISGNDDTGRVMMAIIHDDNGRAIMELMCVKGRSIPSSVSGSLAPRNSGTTSTTSGTPGGTTLSNGSTGTSAGSSNGSAPSTGGTTLSSGSTTAPGSSPAGTSTTGTGTSGIGR